MPNRWLALGALCGLWAVACTGDDTGDKAQSGDSGGPAPVADPPDPSGAVPLSDANNYSYSGKLDASSTAVAPLSNATVSWDSLAADIQCHDLDPVADIDNAVLLVFPYLSEEEVEDGLSSDTLEQVDLGVYLSQETGDATSVQLADFSFFGTDSDIEQEFEPGSGTWLVLLSTGTTIGVGTRMMGFLEPVAGETNTEVSLSGGCDVLDYTADLDSLKPVGVLAEGPWALDWSALSKTGQGGDFEPTKVSELMLTWYQEEDLDVLTAQFLDLELIADRTWRMDHPGGSSADLSLMVDDADGAAFGGFAEGGTWMLALRCRTCPNPAPLFMTRLSPFVGDGRR